MKAILEFELPEDHIDFENASMGYKWKLLAWDMDQWLRNQLKYRYDYKENEYETLEKVRDMLYEIKESYNLAFE